MGYKAWVKTTCLPYKCQGKHVLRGDKPYFHITSDRISQPTQTIPHYALCVGERVNIFMCVYILWLVGSV